jgi:hypothetical protein
MFGRNPDRPDFTDTAQERATVAAMRRIAEALA